ncbi:serine protease [Halobacteriovorax sp. GB3]|uniref:trypsin-like serine peptidase n=1 Tax=Halobacteriovorax sp. GB3 TaxID=2719615 RepID=UPI0023604FE3|nr:serine protease [Halobacteriovorax sp. GB3]MDD0852924.1 serine protease [Halobacteriovorax sp. GB3]
MTKRHGVLLVLLLTLFSCGKKDHTENSAKLMNSSIIIGSLDWKEVTTLLETDIKRVKSKAVATIDLPAMGSRCTGFLISEDLLMTNHHCIPTPAHASGVTATFNRLHGVSATEYIPYDCSEFVLNNQALDFAILRCTSSPGLEYNTVELATQEVSVGEPIYVVQQNCDYYNQRSCNWTKKFSEGQITEVASIYAHNADTLGGSSGSPVLSQNSNTVVSIHNAGSGNNGMGRGFMNYSVPMSKITSFLQSAHPDIYAQIISDDADTDPRPSEPTDPSDQSNTSMSSALVLTKERETHSMSINSSGEKRYFKMIITGPTPLEATLSFTHSQGDLDLALVSESGEKIKVSQGTKDSESISNELEAGTYFLVVYGYSSATGKFSLTTKVETQNPTSNDTMESAKKIKSPSITSASIESGVDLYYKVDIGISANATLEFVHANGDLDLFALDAAGNVVRKSEGIKNTESITLTRSSNIRYLVVKGYNGAAGDFKLSLN